MQPSDFPAPRWRPVTVVEATVVEATVVEEGTAEAATTVEIAGDMEAATEGTAAFTGDMEWVMVRA